MWLVYELVAGERFATWQSTNVTYPPQPINNVDLVAMATALVNALAVLYYKISRGRIGIGMGVCSLATLCLQKRLCALTVSTVSPDVYSHGVWDSFGYL